MSATLQEKLSVRAAARAIAGKIVDPAKAPAISDGSARHVRAAEHVVVEALLARR